MTRRDLFRGLLGLTFAPLASKFIEARPNRTRLGIVNAWLDKLAMGIHKPFVKRRSKPFWEGTNVTRHAFLEVYESDRRVKELTGKIEYSVL